MRRSTQEKILADYQTTLDADVPEEQPKKRGCLRGVVDVIETILVSVLLFVGINAVSARIRVDGYSMYPTFDNGEFVIVNKLAYRWSEPKRGDIIVFHNPRNPSVEYIKRIIGLPGEMVTVSGGQVYINGELLDEPYIAEEPLYDNEWLVPENALYVLGDNRNNSSDSHSWGALPVEYIVGKALLVYWPPERISLVDHITTANAAP